MLIEATPSATTAVPVKSLNEPRTFVTIAWRALKPTRLCVGSILNMPAGTVDKTDMFESLLCGVVNFWLGTAIAV
jgi:hypothetical protein